METNQLYIKIIKLNVNYKLYFELLIYNKKTIHYNEKY